MKCFLLRRSVRFFSTRS